MLRLGLRFLLLLFVVSGSLALEDCKENDLGECKEFLKGNICGRFIWCYKRMKVDNITNLCTFNDTKYKIFTFMAAGPPVPDPKKCQAISDPTHTCFKICNQLRNYVYPFLGFVNVCLQQNVSYLCTSTKGSKKSYCGCAQLANGDILQGTDKKAGEFC